MGAEGQDNRADVHLHGGFVPWISDGGPHAWWDPDGHKGPSFVNNQVLRPGQDVPADEAEYYYPNNQGARLEWYHDHSIGTTRVNAYARHRLRLRHLRRLRAVAGRREQPARSPRSAHDLPRVPGQDLRDLNTAAADPTWFRIMPNSRLGDLWYAHEYDPARWELSGPARRPAAQSVGRARVLRRHDPGQRHRLPVPRGGAAPVPLPDAERLPGPLPEPAPGVRGGHRPARRRPARRPGPPSSRSAPRAASCRPRSTWTDESGCPAGHRRRSSSWRRRSAPT